MLSHANLVSNVKAGADVLQLSEQDVALSFLPLSHSFERMVSYIYLLVRRHGGLCRVARHDRARHRPRAADGLDRRAARLREAARRASWRRARRSRGSKRTIFSWAVGAGAARGEAELRGQSVGLLGSLQASVADRLVFAKIRDGLGGRVRYLVSGSAPLPVGDRGVLPGHRPADHRRLRPDRDLADPDRQPARCAARRHGRPRHPRRRAAHRRGRRDPRARPEHHVGLLQQAGGDGRGAARTAGSTPATSARSTRTGTCGSPIARRTCS